MHKYLIISEAPQQNAAVLRLYGDEYGWVILMGFEASENSEFLLGVLGFRNDNGVFDVFLLLIYFV